jgi:hypothetical protein
MDRNMCLKQKDTEIITTEQGEFQCSKLNYLIFSECRDEFDGYSNEKGECIYITPCPNDTAPLTHWCHNFEGACLYYDDAGATIFNAIECPVELLGKCENNKCMKSHKQGDMFIMCANTVANTCATPDKKMYFTEVYPDMSTNEAGECGNSFLLTL